MWAATPRSWEVLHLSFGRRDADPIIRVGARVADHLASHSSESNDKRRRASTPRSHPRPGPGTFAPIRNSYPGIGPGLLWVQRRGREKARRLIGHQTL